MSSFGGLLFTTAGRNLQAKAQAGAQLTFTRIAIGDGDLGGTAIADLTSLKHQVKSLNITKLKTMAGGNAVVGTTFTNQDVVVGFYWKELGVFAQDPDLGEVLYCYGNAGANAEYIPSSGGADIIEKSVDAVTIIGNASNVTAQIDSSLVYAGIQDLNDLAGVGRTTETVKDNAEKISDLSGLSGTFEKTNKTDFDQHLIDNTKHVPPGVIVMWSGSIASIPNSWALCDGTNGTPDLRDRFIVGAGNAYAPGDTGGTNNVTLTTAQMPSHSHDGASLTTNLTGSHTHTISGSTTTDGSHTHTVNSGGASSDDNRFCNGADNSTYIGTLTTPAAGSHNHTLNASATTAPAHNHTISGATSSVGSGTSHENRPPYYALAYIMKL